MSSVSNYSVSDLRLILTTRQNRFEQLRHGRFTPQETRLVQHPDQTGVLTIEQQNLNQRVLAVARAFKATGNIMLAAFYLFVGYDLAEPTLQPQLRDQITQYLLALFTDLAEQIQNLESKVRELEGLDVPDAQ